MSLVEIGVQIGLSKTMSVSKLTKIDGSAQLSLAQNIRPADWIHRRNRHSPTPITPRVSALLQESHTAC
jgi:hypothetical protein